MAKIAKARAIRKAMSPPEARLWLAYATCESRAFISAANTLCLATTSTSFVWDEAWRWKSMAVRTRDVATGIGDGTPPWPSSD